MVRYEATTLHRGRLSSESALPPTPDEEREDADADVNAGNSGSLERQEVWLMPTLVSDRFGNTVSYHYDPARPGNFGKIEASDGRVLDITYGEDTEAHLVKTVTAGTRIWHYRHYESDGKTDLDQVTLPDGSSWQMAGMSGTFKGLDSTGERAACDMLSDVITTTLTGSMVHPSGATASFTIVPYVHGRSAVPKPDCIKEPKVAHPPRIFFTNSLTKKIVSGSGLPELEWTYGYLMGDIDWAPCLECNARKTVTVTNPEGGEDALYIWLPLRCLNFRTVSEANCPNMINVSLRRTIMAINGIQIQKGLSLAQFMKDYGTEEQCEAAMVTARWRHGYECPRCAHKLAYEFKSSGNRYW